MAAFPNFGAKFTGDSVHLAAYTELGWRGVSGTATIGAYIL